jgi:hypothetical protein
MTLLDRIHAPVDNGTITQRLRNELADIPGAVGLAVSTYPSGTHGIFVIDTEQPSLFVDMEEEAMERLLRVRREFPDSAIDLLCVSIADADRFNVPPEATIYNYR